MNWKVVQCNGCVIALDRKPERKKMSLPNAFPAFQGTNTPNFVKSGKNGNLFVLILDESGSMGPFHNDTLQGVNTLIQTQKDDPIKTAMKIVKFEGGSIRTIRDGDVMKHPALTMSDYTPRGGTNLNDAIGQTINEVNEYLGTFKEGKQPSVIFQITTDGEENCSQKFTTAQIKQMVSLATDAGWMFTYVGANIDAFAAASNIGVRAAGVSSFNQNQTQGTFTAMASSVTRMKSMMATGITNDAIYQTGMAYTDEEREKMGDKK